MQAWQIVSNQGIDALALNEHTLTEPGPNEVKVRMRASSLNYRDYLTIIDPEARGLPYPRIPNSDGAGEITAIGAGVNDLNIGDRVASCFFQQWSDGPCSTSAMASALGGALDGVLAQEVMLRAEGVIPIPAHLSFNEAATLPCAALTAWHGLVEAGKAKAGDTVLLLGTGGVSIFALQFASLLGARVIITSSNDEKLERARQMGAWQTINYRDKPDWEQEVLALTDGVGADVIIEVGGGGTLQRSIEAARVGATIALIGVLSGGQINPTAIMRKSIKLQGIYVGSRRMFQNMNQFISAHQLHPLIDQTFAFSEAREAFHALENAAHYGKLLITI